MQDGPLRHYRQMVLSRELAPDTAQELVAEKLQLLANRLAQYSVPRLSALLPFGRRRRSAPEGLYLYGGVGRGKAMRCSISSSIRCTTRRSTCSSVGLIACAASERAPCAVG